MIKKIAQHLGDSNSWGYKLFNSFVLGTILFVIVSLASYKAKETIDYFHYDSITPVSKDFGTGDITFVSSITRFQETDMRFNDTLFCGFFSDQLYWYSQVLSEYNSAPAGKFMSKWVYQGEKPTQRMTCRLYSAPYAHLPFGFNTKPQQIITDTFTVN